ncbi:Flp pilus assembly protein CpaB, partial [Pseudomonas syringae pv. actinidiae ICMP 18807]
MVPALRVLGIGGLLGPDRDGKPVQNISADERFKQEQQRINARTVTVAVPEALLARLMLASQTGILRLAVRSAEEDNLQDYWAGETGSRDAAERLDSANRQLVSFRQLSLSPTNTATPGTAGFRARYKTRAAGFTFHGPVCAVSLGCVRQLCGTGRDARCHGNRSGHSTECPL